MMAALVITALRLPTPLTIAGVGAIVLGSTTAAERRTARTKRLLEDERRRSLQNLREREEQLANTAHELRTPLTAVTTALELMRDGYATTPEDFQAFLDQASVASRHMAFLINDVVDLAAIEAGRLSLHIRPQRAQELIFDMAQVMRLPAQMRGVELLIDEPPSSLVVATDRGRFLQVVFNLVANAVKYSEPESTVRLVTVLKDEWVSFEVHDQGPGVAEEARHRLFTRFGRVHDKSQPHIGGTGIGLHVCKLLVERMGGSIGFRPGDPLGSVFWFRLRRDGQEAPTVAPAIDGATVGLAEVASA